ncbi:hypothetical protein Ciccas_009408, partial [Cichlidogyrus casuarinus]
DDRKIHTQSTVFRRWLNNYLKEANGKEIGHCLDIFRDEENLFQLARYFANCKLINVAKLTSDKDSHLKRASIIFERLYGPDIAIAIEHSVADLDQSNPHASADSEAASPWTPNLLDCLDCLWMLIVAVGAGTGPATNLIVNSIGGGGSSTLTRRGSSASENVSQASSTNRTRVLNFWLVNQDERLLAWCQEATDSYENVHVSNFTTSWKDGIAFLAIIHSQRKQLFELERRMDKSPTYNLGFAFHMATMEFACPRLLEPNDLQFENLDARAVATYLIELRSAVERDRRRKVTEHSTPAMYQVGSPLQDLGINVTLASVSSYTSSPTNSETNLCWEQETEKGQLTEQNAVSEENFLKSVESTLAWMSTMEESFANNSGETRVPGSPPGVVDDPLDAKDREMLVQLSRCHEVETVGDIHQKIASGLKTAKLRFYSHQDLVAHLSRRQNSVADCLRIGTCLMQTQNNAALKETVTKQLKLLADRWNTLQKNTQKLGKRLGIRVLNRQDTLLEAVAINLHALETEQLVTSIITF